jgi:hypothetical protein
MQTVHGSDAPLFIFIHQSGRDTPDVCTCAYQQEEDEEERLEVEECRLRGDRDELPGNFHISKNVPYSLYSIADSSSKSQDYVLLGST